MVRMLTKQEDKAGIKKRDEEFLWDGWKYSCKKCSVEAEVCNGVVRDHDSTMNRLISQNQNRTTTIITCLKCDNRAEWIKSFYDAKTGR